MIRVSAYLRDFLTSFQDLELWLLGSYNALYLEKNWIHRVESYLTARPRPRRRRPLREPRKNLGNCMKLHTLKNATKNDWKLNYWGKISECLKKFTTVQNYRKKISYKEMNYKLQGKVPGSLKQQEKIEYAKMLGPSLTTTSVFSK